MEIMLSAALPNPGQQSHILINCGLMHNSFSVMKGQGRTQYLTG